VARGAIADPRHDVALERHGRGVQIADVSGHDRGGEASPLPQVVVLGLGDRSAEAPPQVLLERDQLLALALEAAALREVEVDLDQADEARR
jgi:hypothetical protein